MKIAILILTLFLISCDSSDPKTDKDLNDTDSLLTEIDKVQNDVDTSVPDPDITEIDNENPDTDSDTDTVECLDLKIQENVIKTPFPFKDKNGRPTFCRPGCDTPAETDPQCVRNISEWLNWEQYQKYIKGESDGRKECYPWPCVFPDMKASVNPESFNSKCDRKLTVDSYKANMGTIWTHGMSDGVAGMNFGRMAIEYNPEKDEYTAVGQAAGKLSFNENRYIVPVYDRIHTADDIRSFVVSVEKKDGKYYYELIYDNEKHNAFLSSPSFVGRNWVLIQVSEGKEGANIEVKYARAGIWEWQSIGGIGDPLAQEGNIVGDHLTFITNNREIYYCDLRKYPKHINDCKKINRLNTDGITFEQGNSPKIDTDNEYRIIYNVYNTQTFVEVDLSQAGKPKYTEYEITKNKELFAGFSVDTVRGNKVVYGEMIDMGSGTLDVIGCFYRFDKKKSYCPQENILTTSSENLMGYNTFWGKWHLWKRIGRSTALMRDWECYCKEAGVCPFEQP